MPFSTTERSEQFGSWQGRRSYLHMLLLSTARLIEDIDLSQVDLEFANQYSLVYDCPWAVKEGSDSRMLQQFVTKNQDVINSYLIRKCASALSLSLEILRGNFSGGVADAFEKSKYTTVENAISEDRTLESASDAKFEYDYQPVLITAAMSQQLDIVLRMFKDFTGKTANISRGFDKVSRLQDLMMHMETTEKMFSIHLKGYMLDRPLMTLGEGMAISPDQVNALFNMVDPMLKEVYASNAGRNAASSLKIIKLINCALSIISHTFSVNYRDVLIDDDDFYRRNVIGGGNTSGIMSTMRLIRPYSDRSSAYVLQMPLCLTLTSVDDSIQNRIRVAPGSLSERYLFYYVTSMMSYPKGVTNVPVLAEKAAK